MAAYNDDITVAPGKVAKVISSAAVTAMRIANLGAPVELMCGASGVTEPADWKGAYPLKAGETILPTTLLQTLFPHLGASAQFVWARAVHSSELRVSHA